MEDLMLFYDDDEPVESTLTRLVPVKGGASSSAGPTAWDQLPTFANLMGQKIEESGDEETHRDTREEEAENPRTEETISNLGDLIIPDDGDETEYGDDEYNGTEYGDDEYEDEVVKSMAAN